MAHRASPAGRAFGNAAPVAPAALALFSIPAPTEATDAALVGSCLLQNCQKQLAGCLSDVKCLQNLACLQQCNGKPDEQACQIRCAPPPPPPRSLLLRPRRQ